MPNVERLKFEALYKIQIINEHRFWLLILGGVINFLNMYILNEYKGFNSSFLVDELCEFLKIIINKEQSEYNSQFVDSGLDQDNEQLDGLNIENEKLQACRKLIRDVSCL